MIEKIIEILFGLLCMFMIFGLPLIATVLIEGGII